MKFPNYETGGKETIIDFFSMSVILSDTEKYKSKYLSILIGVS